jgi:hypothetical protein
MCLGGFSTLAGKVVFLARLFNFVTDARAVLSEKLMGTNSILLYLIGLWSC